MGFLWIGLASLAALFGLDLVVGLLRSPRETALIFGFSRYNMYVQRPGRYCFELDPVFYNVGADQPLNVEFEIGPEGFADAIRKAEILLCGSSTAFGIGSSGPRASLAGVLREKHGIDVVNLAVPGYCAAQECITVLKHIREISPRRVVLVHGVNDMALVLSVNYRNAPTSDDPLAFHEEAVYRDVMNEFFCRRSGFRVTLKRLFLRARDRFVSLKVAYFLYSRYKEAAGLGQGQVPSQTMETRYLVGLDNYSHWLGALAASCREWGVELIVALQPYYRYGRTEAAVAAARFPWTNPAYDAHILRMYELWDQRLATMEGVKYLSLHKRFADYGLDSFVDAVHLSNRGMEIGAEELSHALKG